MGELEPRVAALEHQAENAYQDRSALWFVLGILAAALSLVVLYVITELM